MCKYSVPPVVLIYSTLGVLRVAVTTTLTQLRQILHKEMKKNYPEKCPVDKSPLQECLQLRLPSHTKKSSRRALINFQSLSPVSFLQCDPMGVWGREKWHTRRQKSPEEGGDAPLFQGGIMTISCFQRKGGDYVSHHVSITIMFPNGADTEKSSTSFLLHMSRGADPGLLQNIFQKLEFDETESGQWLGGWRGIGKIWYADSVIHRNGYV